MRKISYQDENPIDNVLLEISEYVSPFFKSWKHTPNMLTGYSAIFGIFALTSFYTFDINNFIILYFVSYFFDCFDGYFARKYKMTTKLGDYLDHGKDFLLTLATIYIFFTRYIVNKYEILILAFCGYLSMKYMGCQQLLKKTSTNDKKTDTKETLDILTITCTNSKSIKYTRYFGSGTLVFLFLFIVYLNNKRQEYVLE